MTEILTIDEYVGNKTLHSWINLGFVRLEYHPWIPLAEVIIDMSHDSSRWRLGMNDVNGLIYNYLTGEVISRPWGRFWRRFDSFEDDTPIEVTDKIDGELGILYPDSTTPTGWAVATRKGMMTSTALHATSLFQETHRLWRPRLGFTYLFEIIAPGTAKVVNYGSLEDALYLVGIINTYTGDIISIRHPHITVPRTQFLQYNTYGEFKSKFKHRVGYEGVVVRNLNTNRLVKVQSEDFLEKRGNVVPQN